MGENSKIEWTDHTFSPWLGCTKVSAACDHCYAESWAKRAGNPELWTGERRRTTVANWKQPLKWNRQASEAGVRKRVFCASLADVFDNQVPAQWRSDLWVLIAETPWLDWQLLTKRPQNIKKMLPASCAVQLAGCDWPWPNVWLGTTAENQTEADRRIPLLLGTPAALRFVSAEPLLAPIDFSPWIGNNPIHEKQTERGRLQNPRLAWAKARRDSQVHEPRWRDESSRETDQSTGRKNSPPPSEGREVAGDSRRLRNQFPSGIENRTRRSLDQIIVGGESGPRARPMHRDWARSIRDQCAAAGVAYFHKQNGEYLCGEIIRGVPDWDGDAFVHGDCPSTAITHAIVLDDKTAAVRVGKKRAGRLLDGVEHNGFPTMEDNHEHIQGQR